jgi:xylulokinase
LKKRYLAGIDIGTSGCKSIIIDETGEVMGSSIAEYPLYTPQPGWAEQDPEDWWKATAESMKRAIEKSGIDPNLIAGVGLSGQMHGLVALDGNNQVIRRAILWNDQRTAKQCQEIVDAVGGLNKLLEYTNNRMLPGYTGGKILWFRENEPDLYEKTKIILNPKDYIRFKLTGGFATEVSDASGTGLFNVKDRRWSYELLSILDIPKELLPTCYESDEITGTVTEEAAGDTGLPVNLPVVGGGGDAVIQTTGMGLIEEGILGITIGTAGIAAMGLASFRPNPEGRLQLFCNNAKDLWHVMGVTLAAGGAYKWYRDTLCELEKMQAAERGVSVYELLDKSILTSPPGAKNLIFLPYLSGERCPHPDPAARGSFIGLNLLHNKADLTRAVMEGVTFSLCDVFELIKGLDENMQAKSIITSGGGARSPVWRQIQADIFQLPVRTVSGSAEGGAYGAALVAGVGTGVWNDLAEACGVLKTETETMPNPDLKDRYRELFEIYKGLYPALKASFDRLSGGAL